MANHAGESQTSPKRVYEAQGYLREKRNEGVKKEFGGKGERKAI